VIEVQGHRGARGLKPENTLVGFETALDLGVSAVEIDLHLSADGQLVVIHDPRIHPQLCSLRPGRSAPDPLQQPLVRGLSVAQLRAYRIDRNPDPARFPQQDVAITPLAQWFADQHQLDPLGIPTLSELFTFAADYAGEPGLRLGKTAMQQQQARQLRFDLELKRMPFYPETIGDDFDGTSAGELERGVVAIAHEFAMLDRVTVRSFDHRSVRAVKSLEPRLRAAALVYHTAPVDPIRILADAGADIYCPDFHFLDEPSIRLLHTAGKRVIPWTVNRPEEWERLIAWGVDGITTDFPEQLLAWLADRRLAVL
jgi:glycerophosphoryl diester phosphodiesterase